MNEEPRSGSLVKSLAVIGVIVSSTIALKSAVDAYCRNHEWRPGQATQDSTQFQRSSNGQPMYLTISDTLKTADGRDSVVYRWNGMR